MPFREEHGISQGQLVGYNRQTIRVIECTHMGNSWSRRLHLTWLTTTVIAACLATEAGQSTPRIPRPVESATGNSVGDSILPPIRQASLVKSGACSAGGCHGGPKGEYTTWAHHDPHARAYETLFEPRSRDIWSRLNRGRATPLPLPEENAHCLACHTTGPGVERDPLHHRTEASVGCESCHGAAGDWVQVHHQHDRWKRLDSQAKQSLGFRNLKDLGVRADACTRCHVGSSQGEVDHDLIAAGHPPLRFELSLYHARLPKHWDEQKDRTGQPDFEARLWLLGQATSALAATQLSISARLDLAAYDCFGCHHDLNPSGWRRPRGHSDQPLGSLRPNEWYFASLDAAELPTLKSKPKVEFANLSQRLHQAMPALVRDPIDAARLKALVASFRDKVNHVDELGWDETAQVYLVLRALSQAAKEMQLSLDQGVLETEIKRLRERLAFPPDYDSPARR